MPGHTVLGRITTEHALDLCEANPPPDLAYNVWPADLDRDGPADLVAGTAKGFIGNRMPADLVILIGRGDGTFLSARSLGRAALPLGVGDFNADGFVGSVSPRFGDGGTWA